MTQSSSPPSYPVVRLRPNVQARAIRHGFPWVYANELVTDGRTKRMTPGRLALLKDADLQDLGVVAVNPTSKIIARMLDRDPAAVIDEGWFVQKLQTAIAHRTRLYGGQTAYRLVHAEADGLPGIVIDRFHDVYVVQPNAAWAEALFETLVSAMDDVLDTPWIVKNCQGRARKLEGLGDGIEVIRGEITGPTGVEMNGAIYMADLLGGQKTGLFFDQRENHAFAKRLAANARVLDVFSHVGGFALAAIAGGARDVTAVDSSAAALVLAQQGADRMGCPNSLKTRQGDAFDQMAKLAQEGQTFDLVICDPPAFAPNRQALDKGLRAYERVARLAAGLVAPGGYLGLCSCSHAADLTAFRNASARGIGKAGRRGQVIHTGFAGPDHPQLPQLAESGYLKAVFFRL